jgi:WD40 repeat protein
MSQIAILKDTLMGHRNWVLSVAFHPTANLLATGSKDGTAKLWRFSPDGSSATCVATLEGHGSRVHSVAFHPTANLLATGSSNDNTAKLWQFSPDGSMATCVATLEGHESSVYSVAFHPTANLLATGGSYDNTAKLWQFSPDGSAANNMSARCVATLEGHRESVKSVAFHPTANLLATGSDDNTAKLWRFSPDGSTATCIANLGNRSSVNSVAFHPTANLLATGSDNETAKLWSFLPDGSAENNLSARCVATLEGGMSYVFSVAFHPRANLLATGSSNGTTKLLRFSPDGSAATNMSATCVATLEEGIRYAVYSVAFHPTANLFATGSGDYTAKLLELNIQNIQNQIVPQILSIVRSSAVQLMPQQRRENRLMTVSQQRPSAFAGPSNLPTLTITTNAHGKVIRIPRELRLESKNPANNSCPSFKPLYEQVMLIDLNGRFKFEYKGETGRDATGLTKIVYDFLLPVYTRLYFTKAGEFIILKELEEKNINLLFEHTTQIIKLAKAGYSQVYLQIDPRLVQLLLQQNPVESIERNRNFNKLYANLKKKISDSTKFGQNISNYLLSNHQGQSITSLDNINNLNRIVQAEIILRKKLVDFGFTSWHQYETMARFINTFWNMNNSNKLRYLNRGVPVEIPLFSCELKYDFENFKKRLDIKRDDTGMVVDLGNIPEFLYTEYPALRPLLDYILDQSENGNENRRKFVKYVAGTEYTLCRILILLQTVEIPFRTASNGTKIYDLPFFVHTCFNTLDLFKSPSSRNYQEVWTVARINEEITKGIGFAAHN